MTIFINNNKAHVTVYFHYCLILGRYVHILMDSDTHVHNIHYVFVRFLYDNE